MIHECRALSLRCLCLRSCHCLRLGNQGDRRGSLWANTQRHHTNRCAIRLRIRNSKRQYRIVERVLRRWQLEKLLTASFQDGDPTQSS